MSLTYSEATRIVREATRVKSYRTYPLGHEFANFLRSHGKTYTATSYRTAETFGDKLARYFADLEITDFEPPVGTERIEEFLDHQWGDRAPRTYNKNASIASAFFKWCQIRQKLYGNPMLAVEKKRSRQPERETFTPSDRERILMSNPRLRDRVALRILFHTGIRKGSLRGIQFKHFDHINRRLRVEAKGEKLRILPLVEPTIWLKLERHIIESEAEPDHYLLYPEIVGPKGYDDKGLPIIAVRLAKPWKPMHPTTLHRWWYRCLQRAGIVPAGVEHGERMHKARHTAGQEMLDRTGNLKAVQVLLGHSDISTTANTYVDWDVEQLAASMREVLGE